MAGIRKFVVYEVEISPLTNCKDREPYDLYVGSTYVDDDRDVQERRAEHVIGHNSNIAKRGYAVGVLKKVGRVHATRDKAEAAESLHAAKRRSEGRDVWQG